MEIHKAPAWPGSAEPPALGEIVERARPSGLAVEGISTPDPVDHALLLAAHAWVHEPLHTLRDLLDVSAVSAGVATDELERAARAWQIGRIWRTTSDAANALFAAGRPTLPIRTWGRHLAPVRERTVLDNHLQRWLHTFSELPLHSALITVAETLRLEVLPTPEESWHDKLVRVRHAVTHPQAPVSRHTSEWRHEATRRRSQRR